MFAVGRVLFLSRLFKGKVHEKFHIMINAEAADHGRYYCLIINTEPSPFMLDRPDILALQLPITKADIHWLDHESVIACHQLHELYKVDVVQQLNGRQDRIRPIISNALAQKIIQTTDSAKVLDQYDKDLIKNNLATIK